MHALQLLRCFVYGVGTMYFLDPDLGRRRRAALLDRGVAAVRGLGDLTDVALRDVAHRLAGGWAELRGALGSAGATSDAQLEGRIRSRLGRLLSHPRAVEVRVRDGRVTLQGPILRVDVHPLLDDLASTRGVRGIENRLEVHDVPGNVAALQGPGRGLAGGSHAGWSPAARVLAATGGTLLLVRCLRRPTPLNVVLGTIGYDLFLRSIIQAPLPAPVSHEHRAASHVPREQRVPSQEPAAVHPR